MHLYMVQIYKTANFLKIISRLNIIHDSLIELCYLPRLPYHITETLNWVNKLGFVLLVIVCQ